MGKITEKIEALISRDQKKFEVPKSKGKKIKTHDIMLRSPRDFLKIGKVQKMEEEPLTEAQVKHRDRSYIIQKLNKNIMEMKGQETKKNIGRKDYEAYYKATSLAKKEEQKKSFTENAESPTKGKKPGFKGFKKKEVAPPASELYLHEATKDTPI